jgi:hypothetical protein
MRFFQNCGMYPAYVRRLNALADAARANTFARRLKVFLDDRYGASHILLPALEGAPTSFLTNGDDRLLQEYWAREQGMPGRPQLDEILLAQLEHHRTEVFYNLDPMRYAGDFIRRLPGCVRVSIAWRAAPSPGANLGCFDLLLCNFPSILEGYRRNGWRAEYFTPAHDPAMDEYLQGDKRPADVVFSGGYSRHHAARALALESIAGVSSGLNVAFYLDRSRVTILAESPLGFLPPLRKYRRPLAIRRVSHAPIFGRELYSVLSRSKIVFNGAVDMAGTDRGNMRCFEAVGCGALLISDAGIFPAGFSDGETMLTYGSPAQARTVVLAALDDPAATRTIAAAGAAMVRSQYSKSVQWQNFIRLVSASG